MFQKFLSWVREVLNKMLNPSNIKQAMKLDVAVTPLMAAALQNWAAMYVNQASWITGDVKSLNLSAAIASEFARAVTIEMEVNISGSVRADFLALQLDKVLSHIRQDTEYALAKGGVVFKPYISSNGVAVDCVQADMFYPVAFDTNGNMTACVFADQKTVGQNFYTRLEYHVMTADGYHITNSVYRSTVRDNLGSRVDLSVLPEWAELLPEATIVNIDKPLFAYFRIPFANNIDPTSPLGVSVYARATDLIKQADEQWSNFLWEFESGQRALYTSPDAFAKSSDNKPILPKTRLYRLLDLSAVQLDKQGFFEDWTPTLREVNILNGLDAILRRIEFNCGLSYGILSNPEAIALTATEIKAGKQRFYATITDMQKSLEKSLNDLLYAIDVWTTIGGLAPAGTYTAKYEFDDSIVTDHDSQFTQDQMAVTGGNMPKYIFNMRNYGLDEVTAKKWVQEARTESPAPSFFPVLNDEGGQV